MSPIYLELEQKQQNKDTINNLNLQITPLYKQVRQRFLHFAGKLTEKKDKWYSMVGDFFKKKVNQVYFETKDKFLTGI